MRIRICTGKGGRAMKTIGVITTGVAGVLAVFALALGVRSIPDFKRYLRMRSM